MNKLMSFSISILASAFARARWAQSSPSSAASQSSPDTTCSHPTPALIITGSADLYYRYDLPRTDKNNFTSFTNSHNQFNLAMAGIKLEHPTAPVDMVAYLRDGPPKP